MTRKQYRGRDISVSFDGQICTHSGNCVRGLPEVFDLERRPWIQPDNAAAGPVAETIQTCPSGALRFQRTASGGQEPAT